MSTIGDTFRELNLLKEAQVFEEYAIAGAMAFLFYTEPARTYDLDVFIFLPAQAGLVFTMEPLYDKLRERGYSFDAEHVLIFDTPVQFIPAYNPLTEEAVREAVVHNYDGVEIRVIRAEHLVALAYQTGGRHRIVRAEALVEEGAIDTTKLQSILVTHGITSSFG